MLHPFEITPRRTGPSPQRHAAPTFLNSGHGESRLSSGDNLPDCFAQAGPFPACRLPANQAIPSILSIVSGRKNTTGSAKTGIVVLSNHRSCPRFRRGEKTQPNAVRDNQHISLLSCPPAGKMGKYEKIVWNRRELFVLL
jgi:hypothetical protein